MVVLLLEHKADANIQDKVLRGLRGHIWGGMGLKATVLVDVVLVLRV